MLANFFVLKVDAFYWLIWGVGWKQKWVQLFQSLHMGLWLHLGTIAQFFYFVV